MAEGNKEFELDPGRMCKRGNPVSRFLKGNNVQNNLFTWSEKTLSSNKALPQESYNCKQKWNPIIKLRLLVIKATMKNLGLRVYYTRNSAWLLSLSHIGGKLSSLLTSLPCNPTMYFNFLSLLPTNWGEREPAKCGMQPSRSEETKLTWTVKAKDVTASEFWPLEQETQGTTQLPNLHAFFCIWVTRHRFPVIKAFVDYLSKGHESFWTDKCRETMRWPLTGPVS